MITSAILYIIYLMVYALTSPLRLFDDVVVNPSFANAIVQTSSYVGVVDNFLPISTLFAIISLILGIELIIASYKIIMWIIRRIPTQS